MATPLSHFHAPSQAMSPASFLLLHEMTHGLCGFNLFIESEIKGHQHSRISRSPEVHTGRLVQVCGATTAGALQSVQSVYDSLLVRRGADESGSALHAPLLRIRLLRALYFVMSRSLEVSSPDSHFSGLYHLQASAAS